MHIFQCVQPVFSVCSTSFLFSHNGNLLNSIKKTMAKFNNSILAANKGIRGAIGKQIVFRNRGDNTFASKYPDMSNVISSELQQESNDLFRDAVRFALGIIHDPAKKAAYKHQKGRSVYHTAIKDYMDLHREKE